MAKRKQTRTKRNNIDTPLDTSFLFPPSLVGKKLKRLEDDTYGLNKVWQDNLESYLKTRNSDFFINAIRDNIGILQSPGKNLEAQRLLDKSTRTIYVDSSTIAWATIHYWQRIMHLGTKKPLVVKEKVVCDEKKVVEEAEKQLSKLLLLPRDESIGRHTEDLFYHDTVQKRGTNIRLKYKSAYEFIKYWNRIESAFGRKKKRYNKISRPLLEEMHKEGIEAIEKAMEAKTYLVNVPKSRDLKKIIENELGDKITYEELKEFNLDDISKITASYIIWKHEKICSICKERAEKRRNKPTLKKFELGYKTIINLRKEAIEELTNKIPS